MEIYEYEGNDTENAKFDLKLIFFSILIIEMVSLLLITFYRWYKELSEDYYDLFKLIQYFLLSIYLIVLTTFHFVVLISNTATLILDIWIIISAVILSYQAINLSLWLILISHVHSTINSTSRKEYLKRRKRTKLIEASCIAFLLIAYAFVIIISFIGLFQNNENNKNQTMLLKTHNLGQIENQDTDIPEQLHQ